MSSPLVAGGEDGVISHEAAQKLSQVGVRRGFPFIKRFF